MSDVLQDPMIHFGEHVDPVIKFIDEFLVGYSVDLTPRDRSFTPAFVEITGWHSRESDGLVVLDGVVDGDNGPVKVSYTWTDLEEIRIA